MRPELARGLGAVMGMDWHSSGITTRVLDALGQRLGAKGDGWVRVSRLTAKVDRAAVQDSFELYLHGFVVSDDGEWTVVQQGMNVQIREARRYHWISEGAMSPAR